MRSQLLENEKKKRKRKKKLEEISEDELRRADITQPSASDLKAVRVPAEDALWGVLF